MQNYYLHHESSPAFSTRNLQPYRMHTEQQFVVGSRGSQLELYRLLDDDLSFHDRYLFHANIDKIEVLPSKHHKYDFLWILDTKGRFCFWHPESIDIVDNTVLWEYGCELEERERVVFSGAKYLFEETGTEGNIFYTNGELFVLIRFNINQRGVTIDQSNVIKYPLPDLKIRFVDWIQHSQSVFLVGLIAEEESRTSLCVYDLERGLGICAQSLEWRFEKVNLLQFYSVIPGEMLIVTFNEVSLHNYKQHYPLKNYRTRGNYGQGFYLEEGFYGHVGEELITFNRDRLVAYGQVKANSASSLCLRYSKVLGKVDNGTAIAIQTYEGDVYFLKIMPKSFTINRIFTVIGPILEMCCPTRSQNLFAVVSQSSSGFEVSLLESEYRIQIREQNRLKQARAEKLLTISGGMFIIICCGLVNQVFRLNRNQKYEEYFSLPEGNILAADGRFVVYDDAIYEIDYQCFALSLLEQKQLLLAEITGEIVYFLDLQGILYVFDNEEDNFAVALTGRKKDYCWGVISKSNTLLTANLSETNRIGMIHHKDVKTFSIKGHTLVTSLSSISSQRNRYESDDRVLVGYVDGQIHMHCFRSDVFHSVHVFDNYGSMPVSFCACGEDTVLANYVSKQYLITFSKERHSFINVSFSHSNKYTYLFGFLQKTGDLCFVDHGEKGIILRKASLSSMKNPNIRQKSQILGISKLSEWKESIPLLLTVDQRLLVAGFNYARLINLQTGKPVRSFHHGLKQIISLASIKMGIILCGVDAEQAEFIMILSEELELICRFELHSKKPVRCMKVIEDNQFFMAYDDYLTLYKVTDSRQLISLMGSKTHLESYQLDVYENSLLLNDPFRSLSVLEYSQSINSLGSFLPPYRITNTLFIGNDILYVDERGSIHVLATHVQEIIEAQFKFNRIFSMSTGERISTLYHDEGAVFYATEQGRIGVVKLITRDEFDVFKKIETERLLEVDQSLRFSYWQWRNRVPAHERLIDDSLFSDTVPTTRI